MKSPADHYREADRLVAEAEKTGDTRSLALAQIHATLSQFPVEAYLDEKYPAAATH